MYDATIDAALGAFQAARQQARRFHGEAIGRNVNPSHCWADFLTRVKGGDTRGIEKEYGPEVIKAAMGETSGSTGGYTVPIEFRYELMQDLAEESLFWPRSTVVPMKSATLQLPLPTATAVQTAGVSPFYGGMSYKWVAEAATRTEYEPTFRQVLLTAHELTGYALIANPLLQDGGKDLDAFLRKLFVRGLAWNEDLAFFSGNGVGKPLGIFNAACTISVSRATAGVFTQADTAAMVGKLLPSSWQRCIWVVHPTVVPYLVSLSTAYGTVWMANEEPTKTGMGNLHGRPVFVSEKVSTLGTAGDVVLMDPALYVIGDRGDIEVSLSADEPTAFLKNQSAWRLLARVDGQPWLGSYVTLQNASTTVSPFVVLS